MRKSIPKLALRKETVRTLTDAVLSRVIGGLDANVDQVSGETKDKQCPTLAVAAPRG